MSKIQTAVQQRQAAAPAPAKKAAQASISVMLNSLLDSEGYRKRFDELLGKRTPQFVSSVISLVNADSKLQEAFRSSPVTVVQAALKAATFDLPIDPGLGYAYIVPFRNKKDDGRKVMEAQFILGYKGMIQLALRTGVYKTINVTDVRQGEMKHFNRLTEECEIEFIEDDDERESLPIVGWIGYFRLINGTEKTVYMTKRQIEAHEQRNRKGERMTKTWRENFDDMAKKTVLRRLIGGWGLMSIDYQRADMATIAAADAIAKGMFDDDDSAPIEPDFTVSDGSSEISEEENAMIPAADQPSGQIDPSEGNTEPLPWDNMSGISN